MDGRKATENYRCNIGENIVDRPVRPVFVIAIMVAGCTGDALAALIAASEQAGP